MYQIQIRLYQINDGVKAYAEVSEDQGKTTTRLCTSQVSIPLDHSEFGLSHDDIIKCLRLVCDRIAQDLADPLF